MARPTEMAISSRLFACGSFRRFVAGDRQRDAIRDSIHRSQPSSRAEGLRSLAKQVSLSCHRIGNMVSALEAATLADLGAYMEFDAPLRACRLASESQ